MSPFFAFEDKMINDLEQIINKLEAAIKVEQAKIDKSKIKGEGDLRVEGVLGRLERVLSSLSVTLNIDPPDFSEIVEKIDGIEFPDRTDEVLASINKIESEFSSVVSDAISGLKKSVIDISSREVKVDDGRVDDVLASISDVYDRVGYVLSGLSSIKIPEVNFDGITNRLEDLKRPRSYHFTVNRDKNLLITSVEAEQT